MGLRSMISKRCLSSPYAAASPPSNPDPANFVIYNEQLVESNNNNFLVLSVKYPDCTNFEGNKILVYIGYRTSFELLSNSEGKLDPHFSNESTSPIARFSPRILWNEIIQIVKNFT